MAKKPVHDDRSTLPTGRLASVGFSTLRPTICFALIIKDSSIIDFCVGNHVYRIVTGVYGRSVYRAYEKKDCTLTFRHRAFCV